VDTAVKQITAILKKRHNNQEDFTIQTQADMLATLDMVLGMMTSVLGGIAGISLFVGGIGIMNIMLVSVRERTREIGIRKAVGARKKDILFQFLIESATLSAVGGFVGIVLAILVYVITASFIEDFPTVVTGWSVPLGFFFSVLVGVFFGVYPAKRAAELDPIEALRYE
jgi:putative ABC transport system permease protein